ncbi:glycosyltransferase family 9 protein [Endothiovibrio diazotrophicus]
MSLSSRCAVAYLRARYGLRRWVIEGLRRLLLARRPEVVRRIAIHRVGAFGDSVVALPAIAIVRHAFPAAEIDLYSTEAVGVDLSDLLDEGGVVDRIRIFPRGERRRALAEARAGGYDLFIELPQNLTLYKSIRGMLAVRYALGIRYAFGWDAGRIKALLAVQKAHLPPRREVDRFVAMLARHGVRGPVEFPIAVSARDRERVEALLPGARRSGRVALLIGGKWSAKKWPLERWREVARRLLDEGCEVVLIGGEGEFADGEAVAREGAAVLNLCGRLSIRESAEALRRVALAIAHDTGATHLAYAVGTPVVALFSTRELSDKWFPYGAGHVVLERVLECSFCFRKECADNRCMTDIGVEEVLAAATRLLDRT